MIGSYVIVSQIFFNDFSILPFSFPFNLPANNFHITRPKNSKPNQELIVYSDFSGLLINISMFSP